MRTLNHNSGQLIEMADAAYYFSVRSSSYGETDTVVATQSQIQSVEPMSISGGYQIVPEGLDNKFGYQLMQLLEDNNLGLGVLRRQRGLQYGQGLGLYKITIVEGRQRLEWFEDKSINDWLAQWDHEEYLINVLTDLLVKQEYFTKVFRNREPRISGGSGKVAALEHVGFADCRREWPDVKGYVNNVFVGDWRNGEPQTVLRYPAFDPLKPMTREAYMAWTSFYQPGRNLKSEVVPGYYGARKWMQRSNVAPDILKAQTDNGMNIKWHIISPQSYWDNKRELLINQCKQKAVEYKEDMLEDLKDAILRGLANVLSGVQNVGKFFHSEAVRTELGIGRTEILKWEILPIDMKVKDFTEAQISISAHAHSAILSGMGLDPSLSNIILNNSLSSGSEKLYAYKLFLATETKIVEKKALEVMNRVKLIYFPNVPGRFGFYHDIVKREEDITPGERVMNKEQ
jgi:hypothetical protein